LPSVWVVGIRAFTWTGEHCRPIPTLDEQVDTFIVDERGRRSEDAVGE
jgi:hypothetical protein